MNKIGFLGFGWLSQRVYELWNIPPEKAFSLSRSIKARYHHHQLKFDLNNFNLRDYRMELNKCSHLIFTIPPSSLDQYEKCCLRLIEEIHNHYPKIKILFCSSVSVYGTKQGVVDENTTPLPETKNGKTLFEIEKKVLKKHTHCTFLRLGGLIGKNRHPIYSITGKKGLLGGNLPVNLIHEQEVASFIHLWTCFENIPPKVNLVYPIELTKEEFYRKKATEKGLIAPVYEVSSKKGKKVRSCRLKELNFTFKLNLETY